MYSRYNDIFPYMFTSHFYFEPHKNEIPCPTKGRIEAHCMMGPGQKWEEQMATPTTKVSPSDPISHACPRWAKVSYSTLCTGAQLLLLDLNKPLSSDLCG